MTLHDRERYAPGMKAQLERFKVALAEGMPRRGWKVGINVPEVLGHLKLRHSGVGWLDGRRVFASGTEIELPSGADFKIEPELAVHLSAEVGVDSSNEDAVRNISSVSPAFEIVELLAIRVD